jgi:uncharacterized protein with PQ loop repeat
MFDWIGWMATVTFTGSYFCKRSRVLRMVQAVAALLWLTYGVLIHATPVIVANVLAAAGALITLRYDRS